MGFEGCRRLTQSRGVTLCPVAEMGGGEARRSRNSSITSDRRGNNLQLSRIGSKECRLKRSWSMLEEEVVAGRACRCDYNGTWSVPQMPTQPGLSSWWKKASSDGGWWRIKSRLEDYFRSARSVRATRRDGLSRRAGDGTQGREMTTLG